MFFRLILIFFTWNIVIRTAIIWQKMHAGMIIREGRVGSIKSLINQSELSCAILHCLLSSAYKYWIFVSIVSLTQGCLNSELFSLCIFLKPLLEKRYLSPIPTIALKLDSDTIRKCDLRNKKPLRLICQK